MIIDHSHHQKYVNFSGDESPIHISIDFANKVGFDDLVLHGTHLVQLSIEALLAKSSDIAITHLKADFLSTICVAQDFDINVILNHNKAIILITVQGSVKAKVLISFNSEFEQEKGIEPIYFDGLFRDLASVSKYVGMIDPGEAAVFRQLEIFVKKVSATKRVTDEIKVKDHFFENYTIRSIALVNRLAGIDNQIMNLGAELRVKSEEVPIKDETFLIVGFGTLGKVILHVLYSLGIRKGYILTRNAREAKKFIAISNFKSGNNIQVIDSAIPLPTFVNAIYYTSSPKIEFETFENTDQLIPTYESVYIEKLLDLLMIIGYEKIFYPSTSYLDQDLDGFKHYSSIKLKAEIALKEMLNEKPSDLLIMRLPPFASRHHSILLKSKNEVELAQLVKLLYQKFFNWYAI